VEWSNIWRYSFHLILSFSFIFIPLQFAVYEMKYKMNIIYTSFHFISFLFFGRYINFFGRFVPFHYLPMYHESKRSLEKINFGFFLSWDRQKMISLLLRFSLTAVTVTRSLSKSNPPISKVQTREMQIPFFFFSRLRQILSR
jgi:hypothetical protein